MRILMVEDDKELSNAIVFQLKEDGYEIDVCDNGDDAMYYIDSRSHDVILLDRMLPGTDGLTLLNIIREKGMVVPVIMVTAMNGLGDKIDGLDAGADDYISKPFEIDELRARIRALLRRPRNMDKVEEISFGNVKLYPQKMILESDSKTVTLSKKENLLLEFFMRKQGQTIMREQILARLWGGDSFVEEGNVDTYIHFARRRLKTIDANIKIKTVHGLGYILELI